MIPADCILIEATNLGIDERNVFPENNEVEVKNVSEYSKLDSGEIINNHTDNPNPFLFFNTRVTTGHGKALVCCVGENTFAARRGCINPKEKKEPEFVIEKQLVTIRKTIGAYAALTCIICIII